MPNNELSFINTSGNPGLPDASVKKAVRSHVMRKYRKEGRDERKNKRLVQQQRPSYRTVISQLKGSNKNTGLDSVTSSEQRPASDVSAESIMWSLQYAESIESNNLNLEFEDEAENLPIPEEEILQTNLSIQQNFQTVLDGSINPFDVLSVASTPRILSLLHYNLLSSIRTSVHADPTSRYRSYCIDDPAWLFMNLSFGAARLHRLKGEDTPESAYYLLKSISAVNANLESPSKQACDSTIATVACLANMENLNGSALNAAIHIKGLQRMVELRGGLDNLGLRGILRRMVLWSDLLEAIRSQRAPLFPLQSFDDMLPLPWFSPESADLYQLNFSESLKSHVMLHDYPKILDIFERLHQLATFLNLMPSDELPWDAAYPDRLYVVEHCVSTALAMESMVNLHRDSDICSVLLNAGLLYIYTNLRQTPVGGAIRTTFAARLRSKLETVSFPLSKKFTAEMLWALFIAAYAALGTTLHAWYVENIQIVCLVSNMQSWEDIFTFLGSLPVLEASCMDGCRKIWEQMVLPICSGRTLSATDFI